MSSRGTYIRRTTDWGINSAFAERFGYHKKVIAKIGTDRLCRCRSDEARRILLKSTEAVMQSVARKAQARVELASKVAA